MTKKIERFEIEVEGAKGYLAPLTFAVAEVALGYLYAQSPRYLDAGEVVIKSLWVRGSKTLQEKGKYYDDACLQASKVPSSIDYNLQDGVISIAHYEVLKDGSRVSKTYTCKIKDEISRNALQDCLGLIAPTQGNPKPLTAGKIMLDEAWLEGDKEIKQNEELLVAACLACYYLVKIKSGNLKKL